MKPIIIGISGEKLLSEEIDIIKEIDPFGFILFQRNAVNKQQLKLLNDSLKNVVARPDVPIFIDQEGGRISRLKAPEFEEYPSATIFREMAKINLQDAVDAVYKNYSNMAHFLANLGINGNCAPVADLHHIISHEVIGDRSFGDDPVIVAALARACYEALMDNKIWPVIKHIPGHGRATLDSHFELPVIDEDVDLLLKTDFAVFKKLKDCPFAMTAHIIYNCLDSFNPVTTSKKAIEFIRNDLGYNGLIMTDAIEMKALRGNLVENAQKSLESGCDIILYCEGNISNALEISQNIPSKELHEIMRKF